MSDPEPDTPETSPDTTNIKEKIDVEYGDIIQLIAPTNSEYHENSYFVTYIDETKVRLINVASKETVQLPIRSDTTGFTDESIRKVFLLDRNKQTGYARQNGLLVGVWVDVFFTRFPTITAEITNLEEDQIELTTYPALKILYIDFAYRGLPEDVPIEKFVIREKPPTLKNVSSLTKLRESVSQGTEGATDEHGNPVKEEGIVDDVDFAQPEPSIREVLNETMRKTRPKGIVFGDYLEEVEQFVEVSENRKRYGIDVQVNSFMDELLATLPYSARTDKIMTRIHVLIERYKELREMYSIFDDGGNVRRLKMKDPTTHKPLVRHMMQMDVKLPWIIPIVTENKKIYVTPTEESTLAANDIAVYNTDYVLHQEENMKEVAYYNNQANAEDNKYANMHMQLNEYMTPFEDPVMRDYLSQMPMKTSIYAYMGNYPEIRSTTFTVDAGIKRQRFVGQMFTGNTTYMSKEIQYGKYQYVEREMAPADRMTVQSLMTLPLPVMQYSRVFLPGTSLIDRVGLASLLYMPSRFLNKRTQVQTVNIDDFSKELEFMKTDEPIEKDENLSDDEPAADKKKHGYDEETTNFNYLTTITNYVLKNEEYMDDPRKYEKYLQVMIPRTRVFVRFLRKYISNKYSYHDVVKMLEPFMVYPQDMSYKLYMDIRYMIIRQVAELKRRLAQKSTEHLDFKNKKITRIANGKAMPMRLKSARPLIMTLLAEKVELVRLMQTGYKVSEDADGNDGAIVTGKRDYSSHEIIQKMMETDNGELFALLMSSLMSMLVTPEALIEDDVPVEVDETADEKVAARNCAKQVLAKKYESMEELLRDNGTEDVFFDKELDETQYGILKKYEKEKKEMLAEKFTDFLAENLVQKHDCPRDKATDLAKVLLAGKKKVENGQYAVLELAPDISKHIKDEKLTDEQIDQMKSEREIRTKYQYYVRRKNVWVHDDSLDEMAFATSNTLFCNLKPGCYKPKNSVTNTCESTHSASTLLHELEKKKVLKEFDRRYEVAKDELQQTLDDMIRKQTRFSARIQTLREIQREKPNYLAYHLGKSIQVSDVERIESPYMPIWRKIMAQQDFVKRQVNILKFCERYCREPMVAEREEDLYWKYCEKTNTKLVPGFLAQLAYTFVHFGQDAYGDRMNQIIALQGVEEDGFIFDKHSRELICRNQFVEEDQYTDTGFRVITKSVIEPDLGSILGAHLSQTTNTRTVPVFEGKYAEEIYTVYAAIEQHIRNFTVAMSDQVLRISAEMCNKEIVSEELYNAELKKREKATGKKGVSYQKMRSKKIIQIVVAVMHMTVQTAIPSFKGSRTYPGCVLSFEGYPMTGEENLRGIEYFACILEKIAAPIEPWSAIYKNGAVLISKQIVELIKTKLLDYPAIASLYSTKREYLLTAPDETIPDVHNVAKWQHFMPPVIDTNMTKYLQPVSSTYIKEFWTIIRTGHRDRVKYDATIRAKMAAYTYAFVEFIQEVVKSKEMLLKTSGNVGFVQNACCNETDPGKKFVHYTLAYFVEAEGSPIAHYVGIVRELSQVMHRVHLLIKPSFVRFPFKYKERIELPSSVEERNVYLAMIKYCGLDRGEIPQEMRGFFAEVPKDYDAKATLDEKIQIIKRVKRFDLNDYHDLMRIVNRRNIVDVTLPPIHNVLERFQDTLDRTTMQTSMNADIHRTIKELVKLYRPDKMYTNDMVELPEIKALDELKNELFKANQNMYKEIMDFFRTNANLSRQEYNKLDAFLSELHKWKLTDDDESSHVGYYDTHFYSVQQYFKNAVYDLTHYFPNLIMNRGNENINVNYLDVADETKKNAKTMNHRIHRYWGLSPADERDLFNAIEKYQQELYQFQEDASIVQLVREIYPQLVDFSQFIREMPVFSTLMKDREYFQFFDKACVHMLDNFVVFSAIYAHIHGVNSVGIQRFDRTSGKQARRQANSENADPFMSRGGTKSSYASKRKPAKTEVVEFEPDEEYAEAYDNMAEVQIEMAEQEVIQQRLAKYLMVFVNMYKKNKQFLDFPYSEINRKIRGNKTKEKERIMKRFQAMSPEERKVEFTKKIHKLGIWNVGKQKSLFQYDKNTSDRERAENLEQGIAEMEDDVPIGAGGEMVDENNMEDADEIRARVDEEVDDEVENEYDIVNMNASYYDGVVYEEDREEMEFGQEDSG